MHIGMGQTTYGPQLPCCADAAAAAASALVGGSGPSCDPNCVSSETGQLQRQIDYLQAAVTGMIGTGQPAPVAQWFSGVSNTVVIAAGVGLGVILFLKGRQ